MKFVLVVTIWIAASLQASADEVTTTQLGSNSNPDISSEEKHKRRVPREDAWEQYNSYSSKSGFLLNLGFSQQARCAVYLMKSVDLLGGNFKEVRNVLAERSAVFEAVVTTGIEWLENSGFYSDFSTDELREIVHQAIMLEEFSSGVIMLSLGNGLPSHDQFESLFESGDCGTVLGYVLLE